MKKLQKLMVLPMLFFVVFGFTACASDDDENIYSNAYGTYTGTLTIAPDPTTGYETKTMNATLILAQGTDGTFSCEFSGFSYTYEDNTLTKLAYASLQELNSGSFSRYTMTNTEDGSIALQILTASNFTTISVQCNASIEVENDLPWNITLTFTGTR